jgi:hypothetical protein
MVHAEVVDEPDHAVGQSLGIIWGGDELLTDIGEKLFFAAVVEL